MFKEKAEDMDQCLFEDIPLNRDCYLVSDIYLQGFEESFRKMIKGEIGVNFEVGGVSPVAVRKVNSNSLDLSWYPNTYTRFHELSVSLPRDKLIKCVDGWRYDLKPYIFVDHEWHEHLYTRGYSIFALIDAIGVRNAISNNELSKSKLIELRDKIDSLAEMEKDISFISFADSLILKTNWDVGYFDKGIEYSYKPEKMLYVIKKLESIYQEVLGLRIYAVLTQGSNEYFGEPLLHISKNRNHICLNSLGIPFAELMAIESSAKSAIRAGIHPPMQLYVDEQFYHFIQFKFEFQKNDKPRNSYSAIMKSTHSNYYYASCDDLLENIQSR